MNAVLNKKNVFSPVFFFKNQLLLLVFSMYIIVCRLNNLVILISYKFEVNKFRREL